MDDTRNTRKGPPKGNKNAVKHGYYSREETEKRKEILDLIQNIKTLADKLG